MCIMTKTLTDNLFTLLLMFKLQKKFYDPIYK